MATVAAPLGPIAGRELVAQRAAEAMLRSLGATTITVRMAQPVADSTAAELGMACGGFEDISLFPVVVRSTAKCSSIPTSRASEVSSTALSLQSP